MSYKTQTQTDFLWGALVGGAIGAITALLLAPSSGAKLRQQVRDELFDWDGETPLPKRPRTQAHRKTAVHAKRHRAAKGKAKKESHPAQE